MSHLFLRFLEFGEYTLPDAIWEFCLEFFAFLVNDDLVLHELIEAIPVRRLIRRGDLVVVSIVYVDFYEVFSSFFQVVLL